MLSVGEFQSYHDQVSFLQTLSYFFLHSSRNEDVHYVDLGLFHAKLEYLVKNALR